MKRCAALLLAGVGLLFASLAGAADYRSVAVPAVMYDGPSDKARQMFIIARGTPVELVVAVERWAKVRDASGELLWIERRALSEKRTVMVTASAAQVRSEASDSATLVFEANKDVVLEWVEPGPPGWVKVRHADGASGFARISQIWGW